MMTNRERLLAIMDGRSPDRIPWIPRMLLWWLYHRNHGTLPPEYAGLPLRDIERDLGMGTAARDGRVYTTNIKNVEVVTTFDGMDTVTEYVTPIGTISNRVRRTPELDLAGIQPAEVEKPLKRPDDYDVMMYVIENTQYFPCYEEYQAYEDEIGDDGYPLVSVGDSPFHNFLQAFAGYEQGYYDLADDPQRVERLLDLMAQKEREEMWPVVAESPARLLLHGLHFDSQLTPPRMYEKYITPYYQGFTELMHRHDKVVAMHADNDSRRILTHLSESGYDMMDCFTTAPLVRCTLEEARQAWGTDMIIWGGIPSVILEEDYSDEEFETYMSALFKTIAPGDAFILGVADNVTGPALLSRLVRIREMVEELGKYPVPA
jgi:uroporphyrinogen-III decarboxylase